MNVLHLMVDGAIAAAELLALLHMPPAPAAESPAAARALLERPVQLHHLSTAVDVRLLGSLADVRMAHHVRNGGPATADLAAHLPAVDEQVTSMRIVRAAHAVDLLAAGDCGNAPPASGHARLSDDEAIADALQLAPGSSAIIEVVATAPLVRNGEAYRVALPLRVDADMPRAVLVDQGDRAFLLVLPQRRASTATLVLRPASAAPRVLNLGAVDARLALLVPLAIRAQLDDLADGAIELELTEGASTVWTTLVADRIDDNPAQARAVE